MEKYLRFTLGIPTFSLGVSILIRDFDVSGLIYLLLFIFSLELIYIGLWLLDVPTVNKITINLLTPKTGIRENI